MARIVENVEKLSKSAKKAKKRVESKDFFIPLRAVSPFFSERGAS
jgi:hypothetical protein